jgi:hypothetical protein
MRPERDGRRSPRPFHWAIARNNVLPCSRQQNPLHDAARIGNKYIYARDVIDCLSVLMLLCATEIDSPPALMRMDGP